MNEIIKIKNKLNNNAFSPHSEFNKHHRYISNHTKLLNKAKSPIKLLERHHGNSNQD